MPDLRTLFEAARARARELGHPVLASHSELVVPLDPLDALSADAPQMYWAAPDRRLAMLGVGAAVTIGPDGPQRFAASASAARRLLDEAVVEPLSYRPLIMGGLSFEPGGPRTAAWAGFAATSLVVPKVLIRRRGDDCIVTLSAVVSAVTQTEAAARELEELHHRVVAPALAAPSRAVPPTTLNQAPAENLAARADWHALVERALGDIRAGSFEKVVLARAEDLAIPDVSIAAAVRHLRDANRGAFVYAVWRSDAVFLGASPELLVRLRGRDVTAGALAGSTRRGASAGEDASLGRELAGSAKEREEHAIVRRELESSLAMVCDRVQADARPELVMLPHLQHLHTGVRGQLSAGRTVFDVLERLHPTPAVGGFPRGPALTFIQEHEGIDRGWYSSPVGWTDGHDAEFAVALRCALVRGRGARAFAGCGIVAQSDPAAEWEESQLKLRPALEALLAGASHAADAVVAGSGR